MNYIDKNEGIDIDRCGIACFGYTINKLHFLIVQLQSGSFCKHFIAPNTIYYLSINRSSLAIR